MGSSSRSIRTARDVPYSKYTGGVAAEDECNLSFTTKLMKPAPATAKLQVGSVLRISIDAKNCITTYDDAGSFCGYISEITFEKKMLECLKKGKDFKAEVRKKVGESCEVQVYGI